MSSPTPRSQREYTVAWVWHDGKCPDCKRRKWRREFRVWRKIDPKTGLDEEPRSRPNYRWILFAGPLCVTRWWL